MTDRSNLKLTSHQFRIIEQMLKEPDGSYVWSLAESLGIHNESVRSAICALKQKGLVVHLTLKKSNKGPARSLYGLASPSQARELIMAGRQSSLEEAHALAEEIARLSNRLALLLKE